jgi:hypothetical protein
LEVNFPFILLKTVGFVEIGTRVVRFLVEEAFYYEFMMDAMEKMLSAAAVTAQLKGWVH